MTETAILNAPVAVFGALGDRVRLEMVRRLTQGSSTISAVSQNLGISRQAARKHLQVLVDARLISLVPQGRETRILLEREAILEADRFIREMEAQWDSRLAALKAHVERDAAES